MSFRNEQLHFPPLRSSSYILHISELVLLQCSVSFFLLSYVYYLHVYMHAPAVVYVWRTEETFWESAQSLHPLGPGPGSWIISLGSRNPYWLSHLTGCVLETQSLAGTWNSLSPRIHLSLLSLGWHCRCAPLFLAFFVGAGSQTVVLMLPWHALYWLTGFWAPNIGFCFSFRSTLVSKPFVGKWLCFVHSYDASIQWCF